MITTAAERRCHWPAFSLTKAVSIRQYLGQYAIRLLSWIRIIRIMWNVDPFVLFSADLRSEKDHQKHLFFNIFSLSMYAPPSPSLIGPSTTTTPRCRTPYCRYHLAMRAWPFFSFVGTCHDTPPAP